MLGIVHCDHISGARASCRQTSLTRLSHPFVIFRDLPDVISHLSDPIIACSPLLRCTGGAAPQCRFFGPPCRLGLATNLCCLAPAKIAFGSSGDLRAGTAVAVHPKQTLSSGLAAVASFAVLWISDGFGNVGSF